MKEAKFKTNIKCDACVSKVTPFLNEAVGEDNWRVDLKDPSRVLTVVASAEETDVVAALGKAGYRAEPL